MTEKKHFRRPRRSASQLARDRHRIAKMYLEGHIQADIAQEVGVSQSTVSNDLKALQKLWMKSALVDIDKVRAKELAKVDRLEWEYWTAWHRSCEDAETFTEKDKIEGKETIHQRKGQAGDPRFLEGVQWCIDRRCKILGVDAPEKLSMDVDGKGTLTIQLLGNLSPDEL